MDNYISDLILDFNGDENLARASILKRGFCHVLYFRDDITVEIQREYLKKNNIPYAEIKNSECKYLFVETVKLIQKWVDRIDGAGLGQKFLTDTNILRRGGVLRKNAQEKIKKINLHASLDIDCSILHDSSLVYSYGLAGNNVFKFIQAIIDSYKRAGIEIDSTKD